MAGEPVEELLFHLAGHADAFQRYGPSCTVMYQLEGILPRTPHAEVAQSVGSEPARRTVEMICGKSGTVLKCSANTRVMRGPLDGKLFARGWRRRNGRA